MRVIEIPAGGEPSLRLLSDRAAAILAGGKLRLLELGDAGVVASAVTRDGELLVIARASG